MNKLEAIILGAGIWGNDESFPPSALVNTGRSLILFDCGEGVRFRINNVGYNVTDVEHIAITEIHPDHCALLQLYQAIHCKGIHAKNRRKLLINIYAPRQLKRQWPIIWKIFLPESQNKVEYEFPQLHWTIMEDGKSVEGKGFTLKSFNAWHGFGKVETLIYRLEVNGKVVTYVGDTGPHRNLLKAARNADLFICEASSPIGEYNHEYGHLNPRELGKYAKEANAKHLVVTHYFGVNKPSEIQKDIRKSGFSGQVTIAQDLTRIKI